MQTNQEILLGYLHELLEGSDCFLVDCKLKPGHNYKFFVDSDTGFTLEKAVRYNRQLRKKVEESGLYPEGEFSIEISSPGVDTPLRLLRQYQKNIGRLLEVEMTDEEQTIHTGRLTACDEEKISLAVEPKRQKGVKKTGEVSLIEIPFQHIKQSIVQIEF